MTRPMITRANPVTYSGAIPYLYAYRVLVHAPSKPVAAQVPSFCFGRNRQYFFHLDHNSDGSWVVKNLIQPSPSREESSEYITNPMVKVALFPHLNATTGKAVGAMPPTNDSFDALTESPGFELISVDFHEGDTTKVRVDYRSKRLDFHTGTTYTALNSVVFLRSRYWAMLEYNSRYGDASRSVTHEHRNQFRPDSAYPALLTSVTKRTIKDAMVTTIEESRSEHDSHFGEIPESDFSLSAFGLPEPPGVVWEKPTPRYVWVLIGAGAFAALALVLRWLARRSAVRPNPPAPETP